MYDNYGDLLNNPDYQYNVGQVQYEQQQTQQQLAQLAGTPLANLTLSNSGHNVTLVISGGALAADFTGTVPYTQITGLGNLVTLNHAADVANLALTASAGYVQAEVQSIATKLDALLNSLRAAGIIA